MMSSAHTYSYVKVVLLVAAASLVCEAVLGHIEPTNMVMVYLLAVVLAAVRLGLRPAIATAFLSVVAFDVLFVPPRFSLRVSDTEYLITFFALFVVGIVVSTLVARLKDQVELVRAHEERTNSLYYLTRDLTAAADIHSIVDALRRAIRRSLDTRLAVAVHRNGAFERLTEHDGVQPDEISDDILHWVARSGRQAGRGTAAFPSLPQVLFPVKAGGEVTAIMIMDGDQAALEQSGELISAFAGQAGMALERVKLSSQAEEARILREKNILEQALLNSISHDLRSPLVTISGVLDSLRTDFLLHDPEKREELLASAAEEASRLNRFVGSLLDMTRLEAGMVAPRLVPCDVEDIIGSAAGSVEQRMRGHHLMTDVAPDLPPVSADPALLNQALVNLLDNAVKYSPPEADIIMTALADAEWLILSVMDSGPGVPAGELQQIFEKFYRLAVPERTGGTGLGLSIAKGIVTALGGEITASNRTGGGLKMEVRLPLSGTAVPDGDRHGQ